MKLYLGARYARKVEARALAEALVENGFEVTATWFYEPESPTIQLHEVDDATKIGYAIRDIEEIDAADVLILMSDPATEAHPRGGKHVEFGYALGKGKPVIVYGPVENIFHMLPPITHAYSFPDLTFQLRNMERERWAAQRAKREEVLYMLRTGQHSLYTQTDGRVTGGGEVRVVDPVTGGAKGSKACRMDLIPPDVLWQLGLVYGHGATKYEDYNWLKGYRWSLSIAALFRHLAHFLLGRYIDDEKGGSNLPHLAQVMWHCATLMEFHRLHRGTDDRQITKERKDL